ncbi:hypothetical protein OGAPHI_006371 [Ogataea philodendri]|uniref:L-2-hydroxyglutarate dehydrogenase, mitochondrial n=1 Tax=Ogataea philodendri TaxID=1378263 RepID=A0A9P8NWE1_9ASCO|nr:uncharacterized protein OGAPHI_006371 [Ogataea philodendri]KAH3661523.1 hypothetical protein OGAPHI_006371 [Ogataea philodendri]
MIRQWKSIRQFHQTVARSADFTHVVVGAGAVGLAIGAELAKRESNNVLVIEKHAHHGQETSSRNSEVIHAGLYFPPKSLRTQLCLRGKELIYEAAKAGVELSQCGKWVVAQDEVEEQYLEKLHENTKVIGVPTEFVPLEKAKQQEPLIRANKGVLNSPTTGIVSAHSLMNYLSAELDNREGMLMTSTELTGVEKNGDEYTLRTISGGEEFILTSNVVINSAGHYAPGIANMLLPPEKQYKAYYAKGNYFAYSGNPGIQRLIYPCPNPGIASLGTHLTLDLGGQIRFGPDLEWVDSPDDFQPNSKNLVSAFESVARFFPGVKLENMSASYTGIRPKLHGPEFKEFQDFIIEETLPGFVNLLSIESPGLTSCMGIGKYVYEMVG